jgi:hypothetical protein
MSDNETFISSEEEQEEPKKRLIIYEEVLVQYNTDKNKYDRFLEKEKKCHIDFMSCIGEDYNNFLTLYQYRYLDITKFLYGMIIDNKDFRTTYQEEVDRQTQDSIDREEHLRTTTYEPLIRITQQRKEKRDNMTDIDKLYDEMDLMDYDKDRRKEYYSKLFYGIIHHYELNQIPSIDMRNKITECLTTDTRFCKDIICE